MTTSPPDWLPDAMRSPLDDKVGVRIIDWNPDRLVATMPVEGNQQPFGLLHGGATCTLAETAGSAAAALAAGRGHKAVGVELNISYLRSVTSGVITAVCTPVKVGRTLSTFVIALTDESGRSTATARLTCAILPA